MVVFGKMLTEQGRVTNTLLASKRSLQCHWNSPETREIKMMEVFDCGGARSVDGLVMTVVAMKFAL